MKSQMPDNSKLGSAQAPGSPLLESVSASSLTGPLRWRDEVIAEIKRARGEPASEPKPKVKAAPPTSSKQPAVRNLPVAKPIPAKDPVAVPPKLTLAPKVGSALLRAHSHHIRRLGALIIVLTVSCYLALFLFRLDRVWPALASSLPWPVAINGTQIVWYRNFSDEFLTVARLYPKVSLTQLETTALQAVIRQQRVAHELRQLGATVSATHLAAAREQLTNQFADENALVNYLAQTYHWSLTDFEQRVVAPYAAEIALNQYWKPNEALLQQRARDLRTDIETGKLSFVSAAQAYSQDPTTANQGGNLGWVESTALAPELRSTLEQMKIGEISDPVATSDGYHLLKLEALIKQPSGQAVVQASDIFLPRQAATNWLEIELANTHYLRLLPGIPQP